MRPAVQIRTKLLSAVHARALRGASVDIVGRNCALLDVDELDEAREARAAARASSAEEHLQRAGETQVSVCVCLW